MRVSLPRRSYKQTPRRHIIRRRTHMLLIFMSNYEKIIFNRFYFQLWLKLKLILKSLCHWKEETFYICTVLVFVSYLYLCFLRSHLRIKVSQVLWLAAAAFQTTSCRFYRFHVTERRYAELLWKLKSLIPYFFK